jgi:hypothetical protein
MTRKATERHHPLYEELCSIVEPKYVTDNPYALISYTRGPSWFHGKEQGIIVKPQNSEQVAQIVKLANREGIPVVPRGGGASVAGFPDGEPGLGIIVDMTAMNKILYVDEENMTVGAECGIILSDLSTFLNKKGFHMYTVDIPYYIDTLGGVLSGFNGGGEPSDLAVAGELRHYLLGLEVVLPNGEIITTGSGNGTNIYQEKVVDRCPGSPDVTGLFIGDGGIFGIKTKAYFQIFPLPGHFVYGAFRFSSFDRMWSVFSKLMTMDPYPYSRLVAIRPQEYDFWSIFYVIRDSLQEVVELKHKILAETCQRGKGEKMTNELAMKIIMTFSGRQLGKWYASRGKFLYFEHIFKKSDAPTYLQEQNLYIDQRFKEARLDTLITDRVSYIVPKERHTVVLGTLVFFDENELSPEQVEEVRHIQIKEAENVLKRGGFLEGNQGVLTGLSASAWSSNYRQFIKTLKKALDPNNIMNPGLWGL